MIWLKQSTAVVVQFGPFVDKTDGVTEETGLVTALDHATTGIKLSKNGGTLTIRHATVTASAYDVYGCYKVTLDTTDTNTLGTLRAAFCEVATCLPVWADFMVVPANVWDSMFGATYLMIDVKQWLTGTIPAVAVTGVPIIDLKYILGTALTETAGQIAAGFKKFFNIAAPASTMDALTLVATATALTTNNDKTGYSLTQTFPSNFAATAISAAGIVSADTKKINGATINGDGSGTPFGP